MVNSLVWSAEEAKYLQAIFRWQETTGPSEDERRRRHEEERRRLEEQKPAGEFRVLVIGGKGTGKTAVLTRFGQGVFHGESQPPDPFYERGCRHPISLDVPVAKSTTTTTALPPSATSAHLQWPKNAGITPASKTQPNLSLNGRHNTINQIKPSSPQHPQTRKETYIIDALEMPSHHLLSNPMLAQALSITEAAVLLYSVRDEASLRLATGLAEFMREHFAPAPGQGQTPDNGSPAGKAGKKGRRGLAGRKKKKNKKGKKKGETDMGGGDDEESMRSPTAAGTVGYADKGRVYPIILVGTKCDGPYRRDDDTDQPQTQRKQQQPQQEEEYIEPDLTPVSPAQGILAASTLHTPGLPDNHTNPNKPKTTEPATTAEKNQTGIPHLHISSKTNTNITLLFETISHEILAVRRAAREKREHERREMIREQIRVAAGDARSGGGGLISSASKGGGGRKEKKMRKRGGEGGRGRFAWWRGLFGGGGERNRDGEKIGGIVGEEVIIS
ncbi:hypothetical protein B0J18DRAFT_455135 [Chaetomium sp. MPI-SDFR-AT-0129]|nr:hypothetical protein B0J18DRAFT_455135 [Chaetomium sp. MPI-SDFR-AT-0129]